MRKMILTLTLAIVSGVWMTSKAMCQVSTCTCLFDDPPVAISGILQLVPLPCPESTEDIPCPTCLTIALNANEQLYYLNDLNDNLNALLDTLVYPVNATVTGHVYTAMEGGLAIRVRDISLHASLPSLCDEWNVVKFRSHMGYSPNEYYTQHYRLTSDTVMNGQLYTKLHQENSYSGAMREGNNRDIYYVPADSTHEYLLYAFNAQVGDTLPNNVWFGIPNGDFLSIKTATIKEIKPTYPRTFVIDLEYWSHGILESSHTEREWIEGVGMPTAPDGEFFMPLAGGFSNILLCAYKNGEQVYVSEMGEQYGCGEDAPDAMFPPETRWNYKHTEMYGGPDDNYVFTLQPMDTIIGNTRYQQIGSFLFRSKGAKIWCAVDSMGTFVERLVYDFDLQVGDSIRAIYYYDEESAGTNPQYAKVTSVEQTYLADGRYARRISYDGFRPDDIEHIGSIEGILTPLNLPVPTCGCSDLFQCCTKSDYLLYEVAQGACDTFLPKEQPSDTIPLFSYTGDDPGSSTVDPVDPNQVVVTLNGDELTIREFSNVDVTYTLRHYEPAKMPVRAHTSASDTFRNEITLQITESGEYQLLLTNPSWDYSIYGTFFYSPQGIESVHSTSLPQKVLQNGHFYILRGEKVYTITGQRVR